MTTCKLQQFNCVIDIPYRSKADLISASLKQTVRPLFSLMADASSVNYLSSFAPNAVVQLPRQVLRPMPQVTRGDRKAGQAAPGWPQLHSV